MNKTGTQSQFHYILGKQSRKISLKKKNQLILWPIIMRIIYLFCKKEKKKKKERELENWLIKEFNISRELKDTNMGFAIKKEKKGKVA